MKKLLLSFFALLSLNSRSQMFVSTNSYIYVRDQVLYAGQDIKLQNNGNIYLRNESQLLQGTTGTSTNQGTGVISVFQEGTADNFDYNYWCAPIGYATATVGNENFGISMLYRPTTSTESTAATILTATDYNGTSSPLAIAPYWIWKFLSSTTYTQWIHVGGTSTLLPGEGFSMKGTSGSDATVVEGNGIQNNAGGTGSQRYDFRGKPNDGNIAIAVATSNETLTGNPYPSALHLNAFLLDASNNAATGVAYYWEQDKTVNSHNVGQYLGGYGAYSPISLGSSGVYVPATFNSYNTDGSLNSVGTSSGLVIERKYAPIGQGFMIRGATNGTVTLKNSHRSYYKETAALSQFERVEKQLQSPILKNSTTEDQDIPPESHFKINMILNNQYTRQVAAVFVPQATDGVDVGIDAISVAPDDLPSDAYFFLDGHKYVIQGIPFDVGTRIKLGVKASNNASIKFYVPETTHFDAGQMIYLFDGADNSYHDIKNSVYEVIMPAGTHNNRFEVTFIDSVLGVGEPTSIGFGITQHPSHQSLTLHNPNLADVKTVTLFDITGKQVFTIENLGTNERYLFSTSGLGSGVYILDLATWDNQKFSQKLIISNSGN